jgi:hypothetical protein
LPPRQAPVGSVGLPSPTGSTRRWSASLDLWRALRLADPALILAGPHRPLPQRSRRSSSSSEARASAARQSVVLAVGRGGCSSSRSETSVRLGEGTGILLRQLTNQSCRGWPGQLTTFSVATYSRSRRSLRCRQHSSKLRCRGRRNPAARCWQTAVFVQLR